MPLATWLTFFVAVLTLLLTLHQQQAAPRTITPQQVEEIITRVVGELEAERNPDPKPKTKTKATTKTKAKAPGKGREPPSRQ